jgi:hypothetical protein
LAINGTQAPLVFFGTTTFSVAFSYSTGALLTEITVVTGLAIRIGVTRIAYTDNMARLWIIQTPVPGFQVEIVFTTLGTQLNCDYVTVYSGASGNLSALVRVADPFQHHNHLRVHVRAARFRPIRVRCTTPAGLCLRLFLCHAHQRNGATSTAPAPATPRRSNTSGE